ncbi:MAG: hypothetical protein FJY80_03960 [Candidatus Aminicenantes bacterium]|nr:hypothetical protein [Candidatus Aminicenantes bacterium]
MRSDLRGFEVVDDRIVEIYRQMTPAARLKISFGLWRSTRTMLMNLIRAQHPDWDATMVQREAARRMSHGAV